MWESSRDGNAYLCTVVYVDDIKVGGKENKLKHVGTNVETESSGGANAPPGSKFSWNARSIKVNRNTRLSKSTRTHSNL